MDEELGNELNLPTNLALFSAEGTAPEQSSAPSLPAQLPIPTKTPKHSHALKGGPDLKVQLYDPMVNPALDPENGQEERDQIL